MDIYVALSETHFLQQLAPSVEKPDIEYDHEIDIPLYVGRNILVEFKPQANFGSATALIAQRLLAAHCLLISLIAELAPVSFILLNARRTS